MNGHVVDGKGQGQVDQLSGQRKKKKKNFIASRIYSSSIPACRPSDTRSVMDNKLFKLKANTFVIYWMTRRVEGVVDRGLDTI